jgi:hypothetical protein
MNEKNQVEKAVAQSSLREKFEAKTKQELDERLRVMEQESVGMKQVITKSRSEQSLLKLNFEQVRLESE